MVVGLRLLLAVMWVVRVCCWGYLLVDFVSAYLCAISPCVHVDVVVIGGVCVFFSLLVVEVGRCSRHR